MSEEKFQPLDEALTIRGPHYLRFAPNAYSFGRKRMISTDPNFWPQILRTIGLSNEEIGRRRRTIIRKYFERMWDVSPANPLTQAIIDENIFELKADWPAFLHRPESVYNTSRGSEVDLRFFIFSVAQHFFRVAPFALAGHEITAGCVMRVPLPNGQMRWYHPLIENGANAPRPATKAELSLANWENAWGQIEELINVQFEIDPGAAAPNRNAVRAETLKHACERFSAIDIVRADAALIEQQYTYLENDRKLALKLAERGDKLLSETMATAQVSALPTLAFQYRELNSHLPRVEVLRRQLSDAASDIGYKLFLEETEVKYYDAQGAEKTEKLAPGKLFKEGQKTITWITYQTVTESYRSWFRSRTRTYQVPIQHRKTFTYYEKAAVDYDPWTEVADAYRRNGYSVYLFRETSGGLVTADGSPIAEILRQCRDDELFRCRCAVGVPFYENTIIGEKMLVGYVILVRPLPEISPSEFPAISVDEKLTYRFAWQGVALGELAATIPLAPGEERTVTVAVSQKFEASRTVTTSSLSEVTRVDKSDFETVFEKEVRKEKESTSSSGGSIGGSLGGFSGSANFSQSTTTRDMSRQLNRSVQRASQELTRRSKEETTISVSEKSETSTSTTTSYKLKNINEGRTLNITFHRLMNNFSSNLYLNDFDFHVEAGRELVMGTGIREGRTFSRTKLADLWDYLLNSDVLPIDIADREDAFKVALCEALAANMKIEYGEETDEKKAKVTEFIAPFEADPVPELSKILADKNSQVPVTFVPFVVKSAIERGIVTNANRSAVLELLSNTFSTENCDFEQFLNKPFEEANFSYDSGGLHADAQVGLRPATEDYAERMRALEEAGKDAGNRLVSARANYLNARSARNLISLEQIIDKSKTFVTDRMALYGHDRHVFLKLRLSTDLLPSEGWAVDLKGGGRYLQSACPSLGILEFKLPRLYSEGPWDLGNKSHEWFSNNVSIHHQGIRLVLSYRAPAG